MRNDRLKAQRIKAGHSQSSFAEVIGTTQKQVWRYEEGETDPDGDRVAIIAQALGISSDYLLGLSDDPLPPNNNAVNERERAILSALRRDDPMEAIRLIVTSNQLARIG